MSSAEWQYVHLPGGNAEQLIADLGAGTPELEGAEVGRGCIVIQTNSTAAVHVIFSSSPEPSRGSNEPVLRFVVGKRQNSMTSVGLGNPYIKKEPLDTTKQPDALLTTDEEKSRTYWFLYDRIVAVAAMGVQVAPTADLCRLARRLADDSGFKAEACQGVRYVSISSGKRPVSVRVVRVCAPPDVSIPRFRFDPEAWKPLPWNGSSCVFEPDDAHRRLIQQVQAMLMKSPLAAYYEIVPPQCLCLNVYRLLDPLRRVDLLTPEQRAEGEEMEWMDCHTEVQRRLAPVLVSSQWTYFPLQFDRSDCTAITLTPISKGGSKAISEWCSAVKQTTGLRNGAVNREMLSLTFAYEIFPVAGEKLAQARRDLVRDITAVLEKEWGWMEFRCPLLACWVTEHEYVSIDQLQQH